MHLVKQIFPFFKGKRIIVHQNKSNVTKFGLAYRTKSARFFSFFFFFEENDKIQKYIVLFSIQKDVTESKVLLLLKMYLTRPYLKLSIG